jgi:hypothetical protein
VAGAAGAYLAADHATRHQDSFLGRAVVGTYHAALHSTPTLAAGRAGCCGREDAPPVVGRAGELPAEEASEACEEIDRSRYRRPGKIVVKEEETDDAYRDVLIATAEARGGFPADAEKWVAEGAAVELIPPPTLIEGDSFGLQFGVFQLPDAVEPAVMPPAADDDTPILMPYAADDFISFWKRILDKVGSGCCCKGEESEPPLDGQPPDCREGPHLPLLYPGCPQPICPHQRFYCPYSGRMMAPDDPTEAKPACPRALEGMEESKMRRKYISVDTMEFRPSDARPEEFGLVPF